MTASELILGAGSSLSCIITVALLASVIILYIGRGE